MKITPAIAGFIKGLVLVAVIAVCTYLEDAAHLTGVLNPVIATVIAALASSLESHLKAESGNTSALFGAVKIS